MQRNALTELARLDYDCSLVAIDLDVIHRYDWHLSEGIAVHLGESVAQTDAGALAFLVAMSSLNYRFWQLGATSPNLERYEFKAKTGARALWQAFDAAWGDVSNPQKFCQIARQGSFAQHFGNFLATADRLAIVDEITQDQGKRLMQTCKALSLDISRARAVTVAQAGVLAQTFATAYSDPYLKKAQLALSLYAGHLKSRGQHIDSSDLTAMADYQVPRVLRAMGILRYAPQIERAVDAWAPLQQDSAQERAVRSATILACEEIAGFCGGTAASADNALWQAQVLAGDAKFHLTHTTRY
jgi:hypothetical protein